MEIKPQIKKWATLYLAASFSADHFGGIPSGGGYGSNTEYEIGAQRLAEAVHCVLGAVMNEDDYHIKDECGLTNKILKEYSKPIYISLFKSTVEIDGEKAAGVESILENSEALINLAEKKRSSIPDDWAYPEVAEASYNVLIALGNAMKESLGSGVENMTSAFKNENLLSSVEELINNLSNVGGPDPKGLFS